ncbi:hypothetical protein B0T14DRAFT_516597 [Immersiella caudata]|uniref:Uncharacterized protein n=1 Tax=Immersiella caudata TaxID=314043 RepID=A0AA39WXS3_9PEZI|nr:hypothetical protein B0T14DRAFT_516597 [Immersiella caudata]
MPGMVYGLRRSLGVLVILGNIARCHLFYATRSVVPPQIMALKGSPVHKSAIRRGSVQHPQRAVTMARRSHICPPEPEMPY